MKMQQLRYIVEIVNQNLNVTEAANALIPLNLVSVNRFAC